MKIAILGPGAMGQLYGAYLSTKNEVTLVGRTPATMELAAKEGISIEETDGTVKVYHPAALCDTAGMEPVDLIVLFTKSADSITALETHRNLIGEDTYLLTLQNGSGHEEDLRRFADDAHVLIGTTVQGCSRRGATANFHGGGGVTTIGPISGDPARLEPIREAFEISGFPCVISDRIQQTIWTKLMINASSSALTGMLQVPQGYIQSNPYAWELCKNLLREMCRTATADGYPFDEEEQIERLWNHCKNAPLGLTSVYMDIKEGRRTEIDLINGSVIRAAERLGIEVPTHRFVVTTIHALEGRGEKK